VRKFDRSSKKQKETTLDKINENIVSLNKKAGIENMAMSLCHGVLSKGQVTIPENIYFIQYTVAPFSLGPVDASFIVNHIDKNMLKGNGKNMLAMPPYLRNVETDEIFEPDGNYIASKPGTTMQELFLKFEDPIPNTGMASYGNNLMTRIQDPDGYIRTCNENNFIRCGVSGIQTLSTLLNDMSKVYEEKYPGKIIPLLQLSCREWISNAHLATFNLPPFDHNKDVHRIEQNYHDIMASRQRFHKTYDMVEKCKREKGIGPHDGRGTIDFHGIPGYFPWIKENYEALIYVAGKDKRIVEPSWMTAARTVMEKNNNNGEQLIDIPDPLL
jgi:hypothetical protein